MGKLGLDTCLFLLDEEKTWDLPVTREFWIKSVGKCLFHDTQTFLRSQWIVYILILLCCCVEDDCERSKLSGGQRKYRCRMTMERISCVETNQNCGAR